MKLFSCDICGLVNPKEDSQSRVSVAGYADICRGCTGQIEQYVEEQLKPPTEQ